MDVAYARLCLPWLAATVLTSGEVGLSDFTAERLADPRLHALAGRIAVVDDGGSDPAAFTPLAAVARTRAGETPTAARRGRTTTCGTPLRLCRRPTTPERPW
jgi:2-methylcitrate dehydratase PrpD